MGRFKNPYTSENEMLVAFADTAKAGGWPVFPETSGYDMLLVATSEVQAVGIKAGDQVGVEGKTTGNLKLLTQIRPHPRATEGPHYHMAVIPRALPDFDEIARAMGIMVTEACVSRWSGGKKVWDRSDFRYALSFFPTYYRQYYSKSLWHPEVEVWVPPGVNSPKSVSPWKVKAVKLCLLAKKQGYITSADFRMLGVSMTLWRNRWIMSTDRKVGRLTCYVLWEKDYPHDPPPHMKYPEIAEALGDDIEAYERASEEHFDRPRRRRRRRRKRAA